MGIDEPGRGGQQDNQKARGTEEEEERQGKRREREQSSGSRFSQGPQSGLGRAVVGEGWLSVYVSHNDLSERRRRKMGWKLPGSPQFLLPLVPLNSPRTPT